MRLIYDQVDSLQFAEKSAKILTRTDNETTEKDKEHTFGENLA
jgi:hypothetical protein